MVCIISRTGCLCKGKSPGRPRVSDRDGGGRLPFFHTQPLQICSPRCSTAQHASYVRLACVA
ncbi:hypothetical protein J6590_098713, partial [Homalodisca vitripennis]